MTAIDNSILTLILLAPLAGAILVALLPDRSRLPNWIALLTTLVIFVFTLHLPAHFVAGRSGFQFEVNIPWIEKPAIFYHVGVDGLSLWLVVLTGLLAPIGVIASWNAIQTRRKIFYALFLVQQTAMFGVFISLDLMVYYGFWELSLVPMAILIAMYGRKDGPKAALKFFLFTFIPSAPLLVAILWLYAKTSTFNFSDLQYQTASGVLPAGALFWVALAFLFAFAVKVPVFPLHGWLADTYNEAPVALAMVVAGKLGLYSMLRFHAGLFPVQARAVAPVLIALAVIGVLYGACLALVQRDFWRLMAYAALSHLSLIVLAIYGLTFTGWSGAVYQILSHGVVDGALFLLLGALELRYSTSLIDSYGGLAAKVPRAAAYFVIATLAMIGLPMLSGFIGEFTILSTTFAQVSRSWAVAAAFSVILGAVYMLSLVQRLFYGPESCPCHIEARLRPALRRACSPHAVGRSHARYGSRPVHLVQRHPKRRTSSAACSNAKYREARNASSSRFHGGSAMNPVPEIYRILPEVILTLTGVAVMLIDASLPPAWPRRALGWVAAIGTTIALWASVAQLALPEGTGFFATVETSAFTIFFHVLICGIVLVALLLSLDTLPEESHHQGEFYALIAFGAVGMCLLTGAVELLVVFVALEISSISTYVLAGFRKHTGRSPEAAIKYFLLGSFATAFLLYGIALIFGATGSTQIYEIANRLGPTAPNHHLVQAALGMMLGVGILFKVSAAPFHVWTPDVYEGAPTPVVALLSTAPKVAAFALLLRVVYEIFPTLHTLWAPLLWVVAVLSMTVGNLAALRQQNVKRMLAYSAIAHAGYLLCRLRWQRRNRHRRRQLLRCCLCGNERWNLCRDHSRRRIRRRTLPHR